MTAQLDPLHGEQRHLFALAYRMLCSVGEAEDIVQEAYARWYAQDRSDIRSPEAWLTTTVTHLCLDQLKSARYRRETYVGTWLPEPLPAGADMPGRQAQVDGPQEEMERFESVSLAFLSILDALNPLERCVYLLAEVFDYPHAEIAVIIGRSEAACRQALTRARRSLAHRVGSPASPQRHRELLQSFLQACRGGDIATLQKLLAQDVESRADGGGKAPASSRVVSGALAVARLYVGLARGASANLTVRIETINGLPALLLIDNGMLISLLQISCSESEITRVDAITSPSKLMRLAHSLGLRTQSSEAAQA